MSENLDTTSSIPTMNSLVKTWTIEGMLVYEHACVESM